MNDEKFRATKTPDREVEITDADLIRFLIMFAGIWFRTSQFLKAGQALLAAVYLRLALFLRGEMRVRVEEKGLKPSLQDPMDLVVTARSVFTSMTSLDVPPFVRKVIKEMEKEADALLTHYLLVIHSKEEPCG